METHAGSLVKEVTSWMLRREAHAPGLSEPLLRVLRVTLDRERRFPIRTMTALSGAFAQATGDHRASAPRGAAWPVR